MELKNEIECLPNEEWRYVKDFEDVYAISNKGRLASNKRTGWHILSNKNSKGDYLVVVLRHKDKVLHTRIHRLVYETFIGKIPDGKGNHIHHINGDKQDNRLENLCLVSSFNHHLVHIKENPNITAGMVYYNKYIKTKKINQYDLKGNYICTYNNGKEASEKTGVCQRNILQVANKEPYNDKGFIRKQAGGYIWRFAIE